MSPHAVVHELYRLISGPADRERDWDAVRALFDPDALLRSELVLPDGTHRSGRWTPEEFCAAAAEEYRSRGGFWERELSARVERYGAMAHVWSTYESRVGGAESPPAIRGINSVQLMRRDGRWRIVSLVFQMDRGIDPIPAEYGG